MVERTEKEVKNNFHAKIPMTKDKIHKICGFVGLGFEISSPTLRACVAFSDTSARGKMQE